MGEEEEEDEDEEMDEEYTPEMANELMRTGLILGGETCLVMHRVYFCQD